MEIDCPKGWKSVIKMGILTMEDTRVNICGGICDCVDLCGISNCEYYDDSQEGTCFFTRAFAYENTLEGMMEVEDAHREMKSEL